MTEQIAQRDMYRRLEVLRPSCNVATLKDGRGAVMTWVPPEPIVEWNLIDTRDGMLRGMHWHPPFVEYLMVVDGYGAIVSQDVDGGPRDVTVLSKGR